MRERRNIKIKTEIEKLKENASESDDQDDYIRKLNKLEKEIKKLSQQGSKNYDKGLDVFLTSSKDLSSRDLADVPVRDLMHICSKCSYAYFPRPYLLGEPTYKCPNCGHVEKRNS